MSGTDPRPSLTARQREVLASIHTLTARTGYPPTYREIGDAIGLSSASSVLYHVRVLERAGLVSAVDGRPRTLTALPAP